jgi:hypothetical protein
MPVEFSELSFPQWHLPYQNLSQTELSKLPFKHNKSHSALTVLFLGSVHTAETVSCMQPETSAMIPDMTEGTCVLWRVNQIDILARNSVQRLCFSYLNSKLYKWVFSLLNPDVWYKRTVFIVKDQGMPIVVGALKPEGTFFETVGMCNTATHRY